MHRARHAGASSTLRRPRMLILLAVAGVGLAAALWLPTRNDTASAAENGHHWQQSQDRHSASWHRRHDRPHHHPSASPSESPTAEPPTDLPSSEAPPTDPPATVPTVEPTTAPPATTAPPTTPAPDVTAWAPFTDYTAGQLVSFDGKEYQVQQTHTSLPGWEPTKLPDLFKLV
jgi:carbohydrate binding protein with CBM5/12 domain